MPRNNENYQENTAASIASIQTDINYIKKTTDSLVADQKIIATVYLKLVEFEAYKREVERREVERSKEIEDIKRDYATKDFVKPALTFTYTVLGVLGTAILGALFTFILRGGLIK